MILNEAIERYTSNAEYERTHGNLQGCLEFKQLCKWLKELREYRAAERQKYFAYLDGVADGLNESRNDINTVLDEIRAEIPKLSCGDNQYRQALVKVADVIKCIDKYKAESEDKE